MAERSIDDRERYVSFATHCLQLAKVATDPKSRAVLREMAAEWLKLAEPSTEASRNSPALDSEIAAGAFWVQGLRDQPVPNGIQRARHDAGASPATIRSGFP